MGILTECFFHLSEQCLFNLDLVNHWKQFFQALDLVSETQTRVCSVHKLELRQLITFLSCLADVGHQPAAEEAVRLSTSQILPHIQAWWNLWLGCGYDVSYHDLVKTAESLTPRAYPESGQMFLDKVRDIWLTQRHVKSLLVCSSARPVLGEEGEDRTESVQALALDLASLSHPPLSQQQQQHGPTHTTARRQFWGSTPHTVLFLALSISPPDPTMISPTLKHDYPDIDFHRLCVYHDRSEPLHRQHLDDLQKVLDRVAIIHDGMWQNLGNSILSHHVFKRISEWIVAVHSNSNNSNGTIEFIREKRTLHVKCNPAVLVDASYLLSKSQKPSLIELITAQKYCHWCSTPLCTQRCLGCKKVWYCSKDCQRYDWPTHKKLCPNKFKSIIDHYHETSWKDKIIQSTTQVIKDVQYDDRKEGEQETTTTNQNGANMLICFYVYRYGLSENEKKKALKSFPIA